MKSISDVPLGYAQAVTAAQISKNECVLDQLEFSLRIIEIL